VGFFRMDFHSSIFSDCDRSSREKAHRPRPSSIHQPVGAGDGVFPKLTFRYRASAGRMTSSMVASQGYISSAGFVGPAIHAFLRPLCGFNKKAPPNPSNSGPGIPQRIWCRRLLGRATLP
jgi:hypothetical protein